MKFLLNTGRTTSQCSNLSMKNSFEYQHVVSACSMNPVDMMILGLEDDNHIILSRNGVMVIVYITEEEEVDRGTLFLPAGPYANFLLDFDTHGTGVPDFKWVEVSVSITTLDIIPVWKLMAACGGVRYEG